MLILEIITHPFKPTAQERIIRFLAKATARVMTIFTVLLIGAASFLLSIIPLWFVSQPFDWMGPCGGLWPPAAVFCTLIVFSGRRSGEEFLDIVPELLSIQVAWGAMAMQTLTTCLSTAWCIHNQSLWMIPVLIGNLYIWGYVQGLTCDVLPDYWECPKETNS